MILVALVACSLTVTLPSTGVGAQRNGCVGPPVAMAPLASIRLYGQAQWGRPDTLLAELDAHGMEGRRVDITLQLPDRLWVLDARVVNVWGKESCRGNAVVANARAFLVPAWRAR